ncbi:MAG: glutamate-5-semialdehyde dehydrogenase [Acidimicrobiia bacterium]|nr:MAG: glutamate-5-semialdehyde dehydrogenase [Acidimicrobiia bacterium]
MWGWRPSTVYWIMTDQITTLQPGMPIPWGGTNLAHVSDELAEAFQPGDSLIVMQHSGELLHIPGDVAKVAATAVSEAVDAFAAMGSVTDDQITQFYNSFADALVDDYRFAPIAAANEQDVVSARERRRSVTRLILDETMRRDMIEGLRGWASEPSGRGKVVGTVAHGGWRIELVADGLGVVGFVFEGRPNVFADATGVLRGGNTVVFRIGSDALGTAEAIVEHALNPALEVAGLPRGAASLVASPSRAAGLGMMSDPRLALAVARGSGKATAQLGAVARQAGNAVSLHGTGGAWIIAGDDANPQELAAAVFNSLDRKVCNTLNTLCIPKTRVSDLMPAALDALERAGKRRNTNSKLHVVESSVDSVPAAWFERSVPISRAGGEVLEAQAEPISEDRLGEEWEWEESPEITVAVVDSVDQALEWFNRYSPKFVVSFISNDKDAHAEFFGKVDAPFVGNGFTRWVDGQYALDKPELGLSNWQSGRLFGRGGILSGDSAHTIRTRAIQDDPDLAR